MEDWSPETLVKYGFCRKDSEGKIVSVWNFAELHEALARATPTEESGDVRERGLQLCDQGGEQSVLNSAVVPRQLSTEAAFTNSGLDGVLDCPTASESNERDVVAHVLLHSLDSVSPEIARTAFSVVFEGLLSEPQRDLEDIVPTLEDCQELVSPFHTMPDLEAPQDSSEPSAIAEPTAALPTAVDVHIPCVESFRRMANIENSVRAELYETLFPDSLEGLSE